jgi:nucleoid DNA-binding protein
VDTLAQHIEQLLYKHDCVIVPQFGGFVANYKSATVNRIQGKFSPPSKLISFNKNLLSNDGLLANRIAKTENITYEEALEIVSQVVTQIQLRLKETKVAVLPNVGQLYIDINNSIRFEPSNSKNFLLDSFGLSSFNLPELKIVELPKKQVEEPKKVVVPVVQLQPEPIIEVVKEKEGSKVIPLLKKIGYAAALIPFIAYLMWVPTKTEMFNGGHFEYADLNPFISKICTEYKPRVKSYTLEKLNDQNDLLVRINGTDAEIITVSLFEEEHSSYNKAKFIAIKLKNFEAAPESTLVEVSKKQVFKYHIMAGCFSEYKNAEKLSVRLRRNGFSSAIIDQNKGLFRVSFQSYASKWEARKALREVKKEYNTSAWLLIK